jgi:hypothetical protein
MMYDCDGGWKMSGSDVFEKATSKHVIEIRFKPDARFLDKRGIVADNLASPLFKRWNISSNRVDLSSEENQNVRAFFSYRNLGVVSTSPNKTEFFTQTAESFVRAAWQHLPNREFSRVGVRSMFLIEAVQAYRERFLKLTDEELGEFKGDLIDIGFPLNFACGEDFFNVMTGPMRKEQAAHFFGECDLPPVGIFVDVDFFRKDLSPHVTPKNIAELLHNGISKGRGIATRLVSWIEE